MPTRGNSDSSEKKKPVLYIRTFGCQMNVRDSEVIAGLLRQAGYKIADDSQGADIVLFNTCSVRQHAEDKVWSEIGRIAKSKTTKIKIASSSSAPRNDTVVKPIIGLVGCMAQNYKETVFERSPNVDFVVGPQDIHKIPKIIKELSAIRSTLYAAKIWETDGESRPEEIYHTGFYQETEHAYVVISEGCSNYCSYCVVPYVRGPLRHRNYKNILEEIKGALDKGITKVTLLGQNVCAYQEIAYSVERRADSKELNAKRYPCLTARQALNTKTCNFIQLLKMVNNIKGLEELSFITSHPKDTTVELFEAMQGLDKLKKYLHLPAQSGSDRILKLMNRGYTRKYYLDLADNYRKIVKNGILTTDIIAGFPGENEEDFKDTVDLVRRVEFDAGFIFKYSPRPHTSALNFADDVPKEEKERRHGVILKLQKEISYKRKTQNEKRKVKV